jgi:hypothetical protein
LARDFEEAMVVVYHVPMSIYSVFGLFSELGTELLILSVSALAWAAFGRDHRTRFVPERRDPPEAPVAIALMCVDGGSVSLRAIAATVADLAERGALRVAAEERGGRTAWTFDVVPGASFSPAEAALVEALGHGSGSKGFRRQVAMDASAEGWFRADPMHVRGAYAVVALLVAVWLFFRAGDTALGLLSVLGTAFAVLLFGWAMPRRTSRGDDVAAQAEGFRRMLREGAGRLPPGAWPWAFAFGLEPEMRAAHGAPAWLRREGVHENTAVDGFVAAVGGVLGEGEAA